MTFFSLGFRPFFLGAGLFAALAVPLWVAAFLGAGPPTVDWHAHEMLFGFVGAALAGFLFTAVPGWVSLPPVTGVRLAAAVALWLAGRLAMGVAEIGAGPDLRWVAAAVDSAFLAMLAAFAGLALYRPGARRHFGIPLLIAGLAVANLGFHGAALGGLWTRSGAVLLAVNLIAWMVATIGGRIVPSFTANALSARAKPPRRSLQLDRFCHVSLGCVVAADLLAPSSSMAAMAAVAAAALHTVRLAGWRGVAAMRLPIVAVLHVAYAWLPVGLILKAADHWGAPWAVHWIHALTMGAFATMILAVMSRASLGHTGRPIRAGAATIHAYVYLTLGTLIRVIGPSFTDEYRLVVVASGAFWALAFALFTAAYGPILLARRADAPESRAGTGPR